MSTNPFINEPQHNELIIEQRIGFGKRFVAAIIDILASILFAIGLTPLLKWFNVGPTEKFVQTISSVRALYDALGISTDILASMETWLGAWVLASIIGNISYSLIEGLTGASPGKRAMRIYIANADGSRAGMLTLLNRWAVKNIGAITTFLALVPALSMVETIGTFLSFAVFVGLFFVFARNRQALHDLIAQTAVFQR